jgi:hypothetical protein
MIDAFEGASIQYMLVGSYSSNYYGRPRLTNDADFVVVISDNQLPKLIECLGTDFQFEPQMSFETVTMTTRYIVNHPATAFKIEIFLLSSDPHDRECFKRRQQVEFEGRQAWLPTAEDVVITKLRWSKGGRRSKDVEDIAKVLAVRGDRLDLNYLRPWLDSHGTRDLFENLLAAVKLQKKS